MKTQCHVTFELPRSATCNAWVDPSGSPQTHKGGIEFQVEKDNNLKRAIKQKKPENGGCEERRLRRPGGLQLSRLRACLFFIFENYFLFSKNMKNFKKKKKE